MGMDISPVDLINIDMFAARVIGLIDYRKVEYVTRICQFLTRFQKAEFYKFLPGYLKIVQFLDAQNEYIHFCTHL